MSIAAVDLVLLLLPQRSASHTFSKLFSQRYIFWIWEVMQGFQFDDQELSAPFGESGASTFPSPSQEAAVIDLLGFKDENILAWLTLLRSLQQGYQHLSSRQIDALSLLKDSPDVLVMQWLRTHRYSRRWWLKIFSQGEDLHIYRDGRQLWSFTPGWLFRCPGQCNVHVILLSTMFFQLDT